MEEEEVGEVEERMEKRKMKPTKIPKIFQLLLDSPDVLALAQVGLRHGEPHRTVQVTCLHAIFNELLSFEAGKVSLLVITVEYTKKK